MKDLCCPHGEQCIPPFSNASHPPRHCHLIYRVAMFVSSSGVCFDSLCPPHLSSAEEVSANLASLGPQYLSSRSSDIILSDICPIQLKTEALCSINTFLDEFLWNILSTARSLVTDRIKAGVHQRPSSAKLARSANPRYPLRCSSVRAGTLVRWVPIRMHNDPRNPTNNPLRMLLTPQSQPKARTPPPLSTPSTAPVS